MDAIADKQGNDIILLDLRSVSLIADYFVITSADTERQLNAIADAVVEETKKNGHRPLHVEGEPASGWTLLDYGSIIVHLFSPEKRDYYRLEEFWKDAAMLLHMK